MVFKMDVYIWLNYLSSLRTYQQKEEKEKAQDVALSKNTSSWEKIPTIWFLFEVFLFYPLSDWEDV